MAARLRRTWTHNLSTLRQQPLAELSGSLGDLGTLLPLMLALALSGSISLSSTLVFSGLANILTGLAFGIPLPVQPMKAIASIAIANSYTKTETASAGLLVAGAVAVFSITGLLRWAARVVPTPVVRGIQVGAGLSLVISAGSSLLQPLHWIGPSWADNRLWALAAFFFLLISYLRPRIPYALLTTVLGLVLAAVLLSTSHSEHRDKPRHYLWHPRVIVPGPKTFRHAAVEAGIPQLPLTVLNSILAVSSLAASLYPSRVAPSTTEVGLSVAMFNLVGVWFGAMPICHGSGGLAAQHRFGARSGASVVILGGVKLLLGLFVGDAVLPLLKKFPHALLGVMVLAAGVELARVGRDLSDQNALWEEAEGESGKLDDAQVAERWLVMLVTVAGCLAFKNDAVGFAAGMVWHWGVVGQRYLERRGGLLGRRRRDDEREPLLNG
ncbi:hypothetical protein K461DRAFT_266408 [Myriangium duriaei CBS 260.36]|uniref:Sulfate transporter n=1 Tax=Myriangium duriaei CBS 260.36 TaxID=1168546 RepID=A0A9P4J5Q4_9PEZI|nr:hypothetical protein K461DRAFT_266408 [Myriangium duriaei CBS 260.36]